jgi:putative phosphoribosyl transferase
VAYKRERMDRLSENRFIQVEAGSIKLDANLYLPENPLGLVVFVHGSGSSRHSPRNQSVAAYLQELGLATLLFDLLTPEEEEIDLRTRHLRFDIHLLARRTIDAADWLQQQEDLSAMKIGFFGASTGAAAALIAASERPAICGAVVSRGGRPDLAASALPGVHVPTLLIVGQLDYPVIELNQQALAQMPEEGEKKLVIVPGATHLFEEHGALEHVSRLAANWFERFLNKKQNVRER